MSLWKLEHWTASLSSGEAWALLVNKSCIFIAMVYTLGHCYHVWPSIFLFLHRTLPGPKEAKAGSVSPPLGWHLLCASRTHVHVIRGTNICVPLHTVMCHSVAVEEYFCSYSHKTYNNSVSAAVPLVNPAKPNMWNRNLKSSPQLPHVTGLESQLY